MLSPRRGMNISLLVGLARGSLIKEQKRSALIRPRHPFHSPPCQHACINHLGPREWHQSAVALEQWQDDRPSARPGPSLGVSLATTLSHRHCHCYCYCHFQTSDKMPDRHTLCCIDVACASDFILAARSSLCFALLCFAPTHHSPVCLILTQPCQTRIRNGEKAHASWERKRNRNKK